MFYIVIVILGIVFKGPIILALTRFKKIFVQHNNTTVNLETAQSDEEPKEREEDIPVTEVHNDNQNSETNESDNPLTEALVKLSAENRDLQGAKESFKLYQQGETDRIRGFDNHALFLLQAFRQCQDTDSLNELKDLATKTQSLEARWEYLGWYMFHLSSLHQNEKIIELLTEFQLDVPSGNEELIISSTISMINEYANQNKYCEAIGLAESKISSTTDSKHLSKLYTALSSVQTSQGDKLHANLSLDKAVEYQSEDTSLLFDAAYSASESDLDDLSYLNYKVLTNISPNNAAARNNLGVRCFENDFKYEGTKSYMRAAELNNSLAYANLGYKLLNAGFIDLAKEYAEKGLACEEPSSNCHRLLSEIAKRESMEEKKIKAYLSEARDKQSFFRSYTSSRIEQTDSAYDESSLNRIDNCDVKVVTSEKSESTFTWEQKNGEKTDHFTLELTRKGQSFRGQYKKVTNSENQYFTNITAGPFEVIGRFIDDSQIHLRVVSSGEPSELIFSKS
ncbi:tetratricopeptide repeat protein [Vibrio lentus]